MGTGQDEKKGDGREEWTAALGLTSRKRGPQTHDHKKLDSANDLKESESEIFSEPPDKSSRWLISEFQLCETLSRELSCA